MQSYDHKKKTENGQLSTSYPFTPYVLSDQYEYLVNEFEELFLAIDLPVEEHCWTCETNDKANAEHKRVRVLGLPKENLVMNTPDKLFIIAKMHVTRLHSQTKAATQKAEKLENALLKSYFMLGLFALAIGFLTYKMMIL